MNAAAPRIFLCYRREDTAGHTGRLADALGARFGAGHVFQDVDGIAPGEDFVDAVRRAIAASDVVLVVIGREWLDARDANGRRRLDDPADHVRQEISAALVRDDVRIIPLLVEQAEMPRTRDLPADLAPLARRNALPLSDIGWDDDVARLVAAIQASTPRASTSAPADPPATGTDRLPRLQRRIGLTAAIIGLVVVSALAVRSRKDSPPAIGSTPAEAAPEPAAMPIASHDLTMPGQIDAVLGLAIISLRTLRVDSFPDGEQLIAGFRLENQAEVSLPFLRREFQLDTGEGWIDALGDADTQVPAGQVADVEMAFPLAPNSAAAVLRFRHATEVIEVPIDLRAGRDASPAPTSPRMQVLHAANSEPLSLGGITIAVERAGVRRFVNRDVITLHLRIRNTGSAQQRFSSQQVRLGTGDGPEPPWSDFELLIPVGGEAADSAVFRVASGAVPSSLNVSVGDDEGTISLGSPRPR